MEKSRFASLTFTIVQNNNIFLILKKTNKQNKHAYFDHICHFPLNELNNFSF